MVQDAIELVVFLLSGELVAFLARALAIASVPINDRGLPASNACTIRALIAPTVSRLVIVAALALACAPKQPLQPSFFTAPKDPNAPASCSDTLACYARCEPLTEECMLLCDQKGHPRQVELARAVHYCSARHGCTDPACTDERCAPELQACTAPAVAPAPSPMRPQPYPGQMRP